MSISKPKEGLQVARLFMVLSSFSPLFILWAIRGNDLISDQVFVLFCMAMVVIPTLFLYLNILSAKKCKLFVPLCVGKAEDHRDHLLVYLFAMLLPFYGENIDTWRDMSAVLVALGFIVFLFWHLNLHYMNILLAIFGYHVFTIYSQEDGNPISGRRGLVLITKRTEVNEGDSFTALRISNTVFFEARND